MYYYYYYYGEQAKKITIELTKGDVFWYDEKNNKNVLKHSDIKIITPYNSSVFELQKRIQNIEIGTVDKFQGQEAAVVIECSRQNFHGAVVVEGQAAAEVRDPGIGGFAEGAGIVKARRGATAGNVLRVQRVEQRPGAIGDKRTG